MRRSTGGFFSKLTSNPQKDRRKTCGRPDVSDKLSLEKVLGLTTTNRNGLACNPITGVVAYPAGCVIVLYDPKTNGQNHIFNPDKKTITCVNFSSDGRYLVSGESGQHPLVRVWELNETLTQVAELKGHKSGIASVEFSPNQKLLVSIGDQHDMLVNVWNWKLCQTVACNKSGCRVRALSFSQDGSYLVTVGNRHVKFWYLDSETSVKANAPTIPINGRSGILRDQKNNVFTDVMCGRGKCSKNTYCVTKSGMLCIFNEKRTMEKWVVLETGSTNCLVVTEKLIFCGCSNGLIRVFEPETLKFIATLPRPHPLGVNVSEAILPSDLVCPSQNQTCPDLVALCLDEGQCRLTSVYNDHSIYIWDVHDLKKVGKVASFLYHSACIWGVEMYPYYEDSIQSCLPYGSFLTCSADDTVRIWNLDKGTTLCKDSLYQENLYSKELRKTIYIDAALANLQDQSMLPSSQDGKNGIRCMQINPSGQVIATGDRTGNLRIYEMQFFDELYRIEAHESEILCVEFSCPDSGFQLLASSSRDRLIHIFDATKSYELLQTIDDHSSSITAVRFNYDMELLQLLSCGADKVVMFHNAVVNDYGQISFTRNTIVPGKATLYDMGIEPTRKFAASVGQDRHLRIYDIQGAKQLHCYKGSLSEEGNLIKLQFDGGGVYAAISCSDKTIGIYDFQSGECEATVYGHSELVTGLKFTADGKNMISVSGDGCIFVWALPYDFCENIRMRMQELHIPLPPEPVNLAVDDQSQNEMRRETFVVNKVSSNGMSSSEDQYSSNEKWAESVPRTALPGYRFSVGQLPVWAQKQMRPGNAGGPAKGSSQPLGRWGERTEGLTTVPEILTAQRMCSEDSIISSNSSEKSDHNGEVITMEDAFQSQIIYPSEDTTINEMENRSFQVTQTSILKKANHFNSELNEDAALNGHISNGNGEYSLEDNLSDSEPVSDCLSGSPDASDQESDIAEPSSPLTEHFERLGTPTGAPSWSTYSSSSMENDTPTVKLSRSMSISAKFLSKTQLREARPTSGGRKVSGGSLTHSPDEQKRKLEALKEKFKLHTSNKKSKNKCAEKKELFNRQKSIPNLYEEEQSRSRKLKKNKLVSRSCQNLSSLASPQDFDSISLKSNSSTNSSMSNISGFDHRNCSTPVYSKHTKEERKQRSRSDLNSWGPPSPGNRMKRSDSTNSDQFPVKTSSKKISPRAGRRRSVDACTTATTTNTNTKSTSGVVMRKNRNRTARPKSMLVESVTKKEFEKQLKDICHSDDEGDNLFSKMKHAFKPSKRSPTLAYSSEKQKHSPPQTLSKSLPSHTFTQCQPQTISSNKSSLHTYTQNKKPQQKDSKLPPRYSMDNKQTTQKQLQISHSPPQLQKREIDIDEIGDIDMNNYLAEQQADRLLRVANEIDNVIHTQNIQVNSTPNNLTSTPNNVNSTPNNVNSTPNNLSLTQNNLTSMQNNLTSTQNNLTSMQNNLSSTQNNLSSTQNNLTSTQNNLTSTTNHLSSKEIDVMSILQDGSYLNCNQQILRSTPPERDVPLRTDADSRFDSTYNVEEIDMDQPSPEDSKRSSVVEEASCIDTEHINDNEGDSLTHIDVLWNESQGILNNLVNSYNKAAEFQTRVLHQPESDVQKQLLSLISRTLLSIENSISEQRKIVDKNLEMNSEACTVMASDRYKELAEIVCPVNPARQEGNTVDLISLLDKYSNLLLDVFTSKSNRETLIE